MKVFDLWSIDIRAPYEGHHRIATLYLHDDILAPYSTYHHPPLFIHSSYITTEVFLIKVEGSKIQKNDRKNKYKN